MLTLILAAALFAQELNPLASVQAYTTADPINPDRLGLATPDGRYAIRPVQDCDWLSVGQNVLIYPNYQLPPWLAITGLDGELPGCMVSVEGRMSAVGCLLTDDVCDVANESGE